MKIKSSTKKSLKIAIVVCIILLLILIITLKLVKKDNNPVEENTEEIVIRGLDNVYPNGTFYFSQKYNGKLEMNEISTQVSKYMTSSIPTLKNILKNKSEDELREYYNTKFNDIRKLVGRISEDEFITLSNRIQELKSDNLTYVRSEYDTDNCIIGDTEFEVNLQIQYENEDPITVTVVINDKYQTMLLTARE